MTAVNVNGIISSVCMCQVSCIHGSNLIRLFNFVAITQLYLGQSLKA
ncbi:hypothetical protein [Methanobrevibacter sp.]